MLKKTSRVVKKQSALMILGVMLGSLLIITFLALLSRSETGKKIMSSEAPTTDIDRRLTILVEEAYFDGQRDAINGHVIIKFDTLNNVYIWTDSPWDSRIPAIFKPSKKNNLISHYKN